MWNRVGICAAFALRVALFGLWALFAFVWLWGARDSVWNLDFGNIGFKKESLLVFVSFFGEALIIWEFGKNEKWQFFGGLRFRFGGWLFKGLIKK